MCGIAGLFVPAQLCCEVEQSSGIVACMTRQLAHRGPDANGLWSDAAGRCVLGHRRLSIIDTSDAGLQPMATIDGRIVVSFNGEIYNYLELRPQLEALGCIFRGRTDTEVLVHAFAQWGTDAFSRLDGMFAAAFFDTFTGDLVLVRDPFGEKPLYLSRLANGSLAFASEVHALEVAPGFDVEVDLSAAAQILTMQYVDAPRSIYRCTEKIRPGCWLRLHQDGTQTQGRYFQFRPGQSGFSARALPDLADELEEILVRSLSGRLLSDVPLGAFLSGGVDSATVCALVRRRLGRNLETFSIGFQDAVESEHRVARALAEHLGCHHHEQVLSADVGAFLRTAGKILDEPNGDSSCLPTYLLSQFARKHVTVALSGDGGDEMFGGYSRYFALLSQKANPAQGWSPGQSYFGDCILVARESLIENLFGFIPNGYASDLAALRGDLDYAGDGLLGTMRRLDVDHYMPGAVLPKVDRMSMQNALEVRTPFLNVQLARFAERLPDAFLANGQRGKFLLREIAYRYLPREIMDMPKQGFGLPLSDWSRTSLLQAGQDLLLGDESRLAAAFGRSGVEQLMRKQATSFSAYSLWGVIVLESWLREHPARLPVLESRRAQPTKKNISSPTAPTSSMRVLRISLSTYIAGPLAEEAHEQAILTSTGGESVFDLGDWNEMPTNEQWPGERLSALSFMRGTTVIIESEDALKRFDRRDVARLEALGVTEVILRHCQSELGDVIVELNRTSYDKRCEALEALRHAAVVDTGLQAGANGGDHGFSYVRRGLFSLGSVPALQGSSRQETSRDYAAFLDNEQLMPLHALNGVMDERRGIFSIWNGELQFSPSGTVLSGDERIWVVPLNSATINQVPLRLRYENDYRRWIDVLKVGVDMQQADSGSLQLGNSVIVCTQSLPAGGAERQWCYLAEGLAALGYNVTFVTYGDISGSNGFFLENLAKADVRHVNANSIPFDVALRALQPSHDLDTLFQARIPLPIQTIVRLAAAFKAAKPQAVFLQLDAPNIFGAFAAHAASLPNVVLSFRNYNPMHFSYMRNEWMQPSYQAIVASKLVRLTGNHRDANRDYADWIGIDPEQVTFIPNAVDADRISFPLASQLDQTRITLGLVSGAPLIVGIGRLSEEKNFAAFVDVCGAAMLTSPTLRAVLVGVGTERSALAEQIERLGLTGRVDLVGARRDVNVLLRLATLLLITSHLEGAPNVAMEALLMETPVVGTRAGALDTIVDAGTTGFIREIGDLDGLTEDVITILNDGELAASMGWQGRRAMLERFPKKKMAAAYAAIVSAPLDCCSDNTYSPERLFHSHA